eukprot:gene12562-biopygen9462
MPGAPRIGPHDVATGEEELWGPGGADGAERVPLPDRGDRRHAFWDVYPILSLSPGRSSSSPCIPCTSTSPRGAAGRIRVASGLHWWSVDAIPRPQWRDQASIFPLRLDFRACQAPKRPDRGLEFRNSSSNHSMFVPFHTLQRWRMVAVLRINIIGFGYTSLGAAGPCGRRAPHVEGADGGRRDAARHRGAPPRALRRRVVQ